MRRSTHKRWLILLVGCCLLLTGVASARAEEKATQITGEALYKKLLNLAQDKKGDIELFDKFSSVSQAVDWQAAQTKTFLGNIRRLQITPEGTDQIREFFLVRETTGDVYVLALPADPSDLKAGADS
ncbi:MAG: hypothetical protein JRJ87_25740, partial [Deltaproteobacteria bacterium]|nr:hypothetical protein [Deltaproteobacteria bacterium]